MFTKFTPLLRTSDTPAPLVMRLGLGTVMLAHGVSALLATGLGDGPTPFADRLARVLRVPLPLAVPAVLVLTIGALLLICGWCTRLIAAAIAAVMAVTLLSIASGDEDFERHVAFAAACVLALTLGIGLTITGGGRYSVDRLVRAAPPGLHRNPGGVGGRASPGGANPSPGSP